MNWRKTTFSAMCFLALGSFYPQPVQAQDFTGRQFASWSQEGQDGFISHSVLMAIYIAAQNNRSHSECISDWYFSDPRGLTVRRQNLREAVSSFPDYHPSATLLALIQKACGNFEQ